MKKIVLLVFAVVSMKMFSQEQLNLGVNIGIPTGNIEPISNLAFGADINYLFRVTDNILLGPSLGLVSFSVDDLDGIEIETPVFLPISASFYFHSPDDKFYVGGELGYGISISDYDGGLFIKPTVGYHLSDAFKINLFYAGVKTAEPTYGYAGLGLTFDFKAGKNSQHAY